MYNLDILKERSKLRKEKKNEGNEKHPQADYVCGSDPNRSGFCNSYFLQCI